MPSRTSQASAARRNLRVSRDAGALPLINILILPPRTCLIFRLHRRSQIGWLKVLAGPSIRAYFAARAAREILPLTPGASIVADWIAEVILDKTRGTSVIIVG